VRILVTGHKGYIGTVMVPMLLAEGHQVAGIDSGLFEECLFQGPVTDIPEVRRDIRDVQASDLEGFDALVHLAALSNDPLGDLNPQLTDEINHLATVRLARLAGEARIERFLFSSTCSVYGAAGEEMVTEEASLDPITPYGFSKVFAEKEVGQLADSSFSPVFLRSATAYGASPYLRFDLVLNNLVAWAFTRGRVYLKSDGTAWRPVVHIEDIAGAFITVLHAPREVVHNQAFNVGMSEENYRIRELAEIVEQTVPGSRIEYAKDGGTDSRCYRVDCSKLARTLPAFQPRWTARRGAQQLYEAYRMASLTIDDFDGPRFKRIAHIKQLLRTGRLRATMRWRGQGFA
jgi:nucleoside-diphosphate-sugar epimerase